MNYLYNYFFIRKFYKTLFYGFYGTLNICLYNDWKFFYITRLNLSEQIIQ